METYRVIVKEGQSEDKDHVPLGIITVKDWQSTSSMCWFHCRKGLTRSREPSEREGSVLRMSV